MKNHMARRKFPERSENKKGGEKSKKHSRKKRRKFEQNSREQYIHTPEGFKRAYTTAPMTAPMTQRTPLTYHRFSLHLLRSTWYMIVYICRRGQNYHRTCVAYLVFSGGDLSNLHEPGHVSWTGFVRHRSSTTSHDSRSRTLGGSQ